MDSLSVERVRKTFCVVKCLLSSVVTLASVIDRRLAEGVAELARLMDALELRSEIAKCVEQCVGSELAVEVDEKARHATHYARAVALAGAAAVLLDPANLADVVGSVLEIDEVTVAELKGMIDALCRLSRNKNKDRGGGDADRR